MDRIYWLGARASEMELYYETCCTTIRMNIRDIYVFIQYTYYTTLHKSQQKYTYMDMVLDLKGILVININQKKTYYKKLQYMFCIFKNNHLLSKLK